MYFSHILSFLTNTTKLSDMYAFLRDSNLFRKIIDSYFIFKNVPKQNYVCFANFVFNHNEPILKSEFNIKKDGMVLYFPLTRYTWNNMDRGFLQRKKREDF